MKKILMSLVVASVLLVSFGVVSAAKDKTCTAIQDGTLLTSAGDVIMTGYDQWGYNYQAHIFLGGYCDAYRNAAWCQEWKDVNLIMKWSDDWLSNQDCNNDGKLDRGGLSGISQGWLTNHQWGSYLGENGETCNWDYFVKIVYPCLEFGENGQCIWGSYSVIEEISNDPCADQTGVLYKVQAPVGLGFY